MLHILSQEYSNICHFYKVSPLNGSNGNRPTVSKYKDLQS